MTFNVADFVREIRPFTGVPCGGEAIQEKGRLIFGITILGTGFHVDCIEVEDQHGIAAVNADHQDALNKVLDAADQADFGTVDLIVDGNEGKYVIFIHPMEA